MSVESIDRWVLRRAAAVLACAVLIACQESSKPDTEAVLEAARQAGRVVTLEEHQAAGGFGSAVAEFLVEHHPVPMRLLGVQDQFGQSGSPEELLAHYELDQRHIEEAVRALIPAK